MKKDWKLSVLLLCNHRIILSKWILIENNPRTKTFENQSFAVILRINSNFALFDFLLFREERKNIFGAFYEKKNRFKHSSQARWHRK